LSTTAVSTYKGQIFLLVICVIPFKFWRGDMHGVVCGSVELVWLKVER